MCKNKSFSHLSLQKLDYKKFKNNDLYFKFRTIFNSENINQPISDGKLFCNIIPKEYYSNDYVLLDLYSNKYSVFFLFRNIKTNNKIILELNKFNYFYKIKENNYDSYPVIDVSKVKAYKKPYPFEEDYTCYESNIDIITKYFSDYIYIKGMENFSKSFSNYKIKKAFLDIEFNTEFSVNMRTLDESAPAPITFISYFSESAGRNIFISLSSLSKRLYDGIFLLTKGKEEEIKKLKRKKPEELSELLIKNNKRINKYIDYLKNNINEYKKKYNVEEDINIHIYKTEAEMLFYFLSFLNKDNPDYISGWNIGFDITYIISRIKIELPNLWINDLPKKPIKKLIKKLDMYGESYAYRSKDNTKYFCSIPGYVAFDLQEYFLNLQMEELPRTSLDYVTSEIIFKKHIQKGDKRFKKLSMPNEMWIDQINNPNLTEEEVFEKNLKNLAEWINYNMRDTDLLYYIDEELHLIDYYKTLQSMAGCPVKFTLFNSKIVLSYILNIYKSNHKVIRTIKPKNKHDKLMGGFGQYKIKGRYKYLVDYDASSMYPSIMRDLNIGWDTEIMKVPYEFAFKYVVRNLSKEDLEKKYKVKINPFICVIYDGSIKETELTGYQILKIIKSKKLYVSPNGALFKNHNDTKAVTYELLNNLINLRTELKNKLKELMERGEYDVSLDNEQKTTKAIANSFYGVAGFEKFPLGHSDLINAVTYFGRFEIKCVMITINEYLKEKVNNPNLKPEEYDVKKLLPLFQKIDIEKQNDLDLDFVVYTDTDGTVIHFEHIVNSIEETDEYMKEINIIINKKLLPFLRLLTNTGLHVPENKFLKFKDEFVASIGVFYGVSKKYCMAITRKHQKNLPNIEYEIRKNIFPNRVPKYTKKFLEDLIKDYLLNENVGIDDIFNYIDKISDHLYKIVKDKKIELFGSPVTLRTVITSYGKVSLPKSVNGMLWYNHLIENKWYSSQKGLLVSIKGFDEFLMPDNIKEKYFNLKKNNFYIKNGDIEVKLKHNSFTIFPEDELPEWVILDIDKIIHDIWIHLSHEIIKPIISNEGKINFIFF